MPEGVRPLSSASSSNATASESGAPNFDDSGNRLWVSSTDTRTTTPAPGALVAIFLISAALSAANNRTPAWYVAVMWAAGFTVLLYNTWRASPPTATTGANSAADAISKFAPARASASSTTGSALHFTA